MREELKRGIDAAKNDNFKEPYRDKYGMYGTEPVQEFEKDETPELDFHTEEVPDVADVIPESEEIEDAE